MSQTCLRGVDDITSLEYFLIIRLTLPTLSTSYVGAMVPSRMPDLVETVKLFISILDYYPY